MVSTGPREGYRRKHRSLVDDVADHANIRRDVVEEVLDGLFDVLAERILNERKLILPGLLSVSTVVTKNGIRPEPHLQYRAKVAIGLRKLLQKMEEDPSLEVDRDSWREKARAAVPQSKSKPVSMDLNDFLRDDDEDL